MVLKHFANAGCFLWKGVKHGSYGCSTKCSYSVSFLVFSFSLTLMFFSFWLRLQKSALPAHFHFFLPSFSFRQTAVLAHRVKLSEKTDSTVSPASAKTGGSSENFDIRIPCSFRFLALFFFDQRLKNPVFIKCIRRKPGNLFDRFAQAYAESR